MNNKLAVLFVEGETEEEFYKKLISTIRNRKQTLPCHIRVKNASGIGNFKDKVLRIFTKNILMNYPNFEITVFLCIDTDVFDLSKKPPIDLQKASDEIKNAGANKVHIIKAKRSIEDWFLYDINGIADYLNINRRKIKIPASGNGYEKLQKLFSTKNKVYLKGKKSEGFVDKLDVDLIMSKVCTEIAPLCKTLGEECRNDGCCKMNK